MKGKSESEVAQSCPTQRPRGLQPTRLFHPWDFPGKSTGVGCQCLLRKKVLQRSKRFIGLLIAALVGIIAIATTTAVAGELRIKLYKRLRLYSRGTKMQILPGSPTRGGNTKFLITNSS